jgi:hypothetical protein
MAQMTSPRFTNTRFLGLSHHFYVEEAVQTTQVNNNVPTEPNVPKVTEPQRGRIQGSVIDVENKDIVIEMLVTVD